MKKHPCGGSSESPQGCFLCLEITIQVQYINHPGDGCFDNISLIQDDPRGSFCSYNTDGYLERYERGKNTTWYAYDDNNNVVLILDTDKTITRYTYDDHNRVTKKFDEVYVGNLVLEDDLPISLDEQPITRHVSYISLYTYNTYGQQTGVCIGTQSPDDSGSAGKYTEAYFTYNVTLGSHIFGTLATETDVLGNVTRYFYDTNNGRLKASIAPDGTGVCYTYDGVGNLIEVLPATLNTAQNGYTANSSNASVDYTYDAANRLSTITTDSTVYSFTYDVFGKSNDISVGGNELAEYEYNANNGKINTLYYGGKDENGNARGLAVKYVYDELDRTSEMWYNTGEDGAYQRVYSYQYDTAGNLFSATDHINKQVTMYNYDPAGKLVLSYVYDLDASENQHTTEFDYDDQSRVEYQINRLNCSTSTGQSLHSTILDYFYDEETGLLKEMVLSYSSLDGTIEIDYEALQKPYNKAIAFSENSAQIFYQNVSFIYASNDDISLTEYGESSRIERMTVAIRQSKTSSLISSTAYSYRYDDNGNITHISVGDSIQYRYTYDDLGQLIREDNAPLEKSYVYTYDTAGNLLSKEEYSFTTETLGAALKTYNYSYDNASWGDQLTKYDRQTILYDEIGNPTRIGEYSQEEDRWISATDYIWNGRQLIEVKVMSCCSDGSVEETSSVTTYTYNADGIRTSKTVEKDKHTYYLNGSQILAEVWFDIFEGDDRIEYMLIYLYDESGAPIGLKYRENIYADNQFDCFFFEKNLQGDIVAICNDEGEKIGTYTYDAWGKHTIQTVSGNSWLETAIVRHYNPFRYRGYYYDTDTGLYYLQSRYYDPQWGRFLNADGYINANRDILGYNMYAYCNNNPIMNIDPAGTCSRVFFGLFKRDCKQTTCPDSRRYQKPESVPELSAQAKEQAINAANNARVYVYHNEDTNVKTIRIDVTFSDPNQQFDAATADVYYNRLYDRTVELAEKENIDRSDLMSVNHIRWEYEWHKSMCNPAFGPIYEHAKVATLNPEETRWSMIWRGVKAFFE